MEIVTVDGRYAGGGGVWVIGEVSAQSTRVYTARWEKTSAKNFSNLVIKTVDRRGCNDGSRELIPVFHNPHRKGRPSPPAVVRTLEYFVGVPL